MPLTYSELEKTNPWFPNPPHPDQVAERTRHGLPIAVEHPASGYALVLVPGSVETEPFYLGATPVTFRTVVEVTGIPDIGTGRTRDPKYEVADEERLDLPATDLTFQEIKMFLRRAGGHLELPSPEQWRWAAGFGVAPSTQYWEGLLWTDPYDGGRTNTAWELRRRPNRPGEYPPNPLGLYDMIGNVWELCRRLEQNPTGRMPRGDRPRFVLKGGSWATAPEFATVDTEVQLDDDVDDVDEHWSDPFVGVRCAASWSNVKKGLRR